ncbi:MAG TPA: acyclic terpene utilization AtuA family protein [Actinoplanes sp.]|nr:acyclic terpene utilization AtuA family protein [Actinoplanes sp.]
MTASTPRALAASPGVIRIGNCSGFYGDRFSAMREMLDGGELDVLTGDYLAELTMLILGRDRLKNADLGYAKTFLRQMEDCLSAAVDRGVRIVVNAGGLNPAGLTARLRELAGRLGVTARFGYVEGDDLTARAGELGLGSPLTANAYLGAWGIARCLNAGADVVVTGRVTDASLTVGPAAAHFGWGRDDYNRLAGAVAAGHVIECGAQATGGNYSFFTEIAELTRPGFPIAEIHRDGSSVITKHPGTGGAVTVDTVTAQLVYEIAGARYAGPDVTTRLDTLDLAQDGPDRVRITAVIGEPPPPTLKVSLNAIGGFRNEMAFILTGLDIEAKAALVRAQFAAGLSTKPAELTWTLARLDRPDAETEEQASAILRCVARDRDPEVVARAFADVAVELALASYPGFALTSAPGPGSVYGVFAAGAVAVAEVPHVAVLPDGTRVDIAPGGDTRALEDVAEPEPPPPLATGRARRVPLGTIAGARSGDKGGNANIGVWVRSDEQWRWLAGALTVERLRQMLPEVADLPITRTVLPRLRAVNFVVEGILGQGVAYQARFDPQAKGLGEWLRSRQIAVPEELLTA